MAAHSRKVYVETEIRTSIERLWELTQTPDRHQRWDLRFSRINYLPRCSPAEPQRFEYVTKIGFGVTVRGKGESVGSSDGPNGQRFSALRFWSEDPKSLIREGSGYWKYLPQPQRGTIRFLTLYDYQTRFGRIGRGIDGWLFRPLLGWATAWSFDRLRIWIESGVDPVASACFAVTYFLARMAVAFVWLYEGIVPKLIFRHADELAMLRAAGFPAQAANGACLTIGTIEAAIGLSLLLLWRWRGLLWLTLAGMPLALFCVAVAAPRFLVSPFDPVVLNLSVFALAAIALLAGRFAPSASRCLRRPLGGET